MVIQILIYVCSSEYALTVQLSIPKESFEQVQLTLVLPSQIISIQLSLRARIIKSIYDKFNFSTVFLGEVACMAALGSAHGTALVLNFESEGIEVAAVNDFSIVASSVEYFPVGSNRFYSFSTGRTFETQDDIDMAIEGFIKHFVLERSPSGLNLIDVIESVIKRLDSDRRAITLNHIILNGTFVLPYPVLVSCLQAALENSSILATSDYPAESQPTHFAFKSIPEYYNEIMESGRESIAFFGASVTGKYAHSDIIRNSKQSQ